MFYYLRVKITDALLPIVAMQEAGDINRKLNGLL
ncbi:hypothetical protein POKO110462_02390 [Pontibacter korlensis]